MNKRFKFRNNELVFEELEPRLLLSADSLAVIADANSSTQHELVISDDTLDAATQDATLDQASNPGVTSESASDNKRSELVIIDSRAPNFQQLYNDALKAQHSGKQVHVIVLDAHRDGIEQISEALQRFNQLDAVHIVSHGDEGRLKIGATQLNNASLRQYSDDIAQWKQAFSQNGDILIYGCNLASNTNGAALVDKLGELTGTEVAASDDLTGDRLQGGDWDLEYQTGDIESNIAFSSDLQQSWQGTLEGAVQSGGETQPIQEEEGKEQQAQQQAEQEAARLEEEQQEAARVEEEQQAVVSEEQRQEIVIIDESVAEYQSFIDDLQNNSNSTTRFDIVVLDAETDGIEQINNLLSAYDNVDALHIISHSNDGSVKLGKTWLSNNNIEQYSDSLSNWASSLDQNADILIYGCNLADSESGESFVNQLAQLTEADVAASNDVTGNAALGGDWDLEYRHGVIETDIAVSAELQQAYANILATETVADDLSSGDFTGNTGSQNWSGNWVEVDAGGAGEATGNVIVSGGEISITATGSSVAREVDLSSATSATFSFDYRTGSGVESTDPDSLVVEISDDGGTTWYTLEDINNLDGVNSGSKSYDISAYMAVDTQIRLRANNGYSGPDEFFYVDNVQIQYTTNTAITVSATGASTTAAGSLYTLNLNASDDVDSWTINWGDGVIETVAGNPSSVSHTYATGSEGQTYNILVSATDASGTYSNSELIAATDFLTGEGLYRYSDSGAFEQYFSGAELTDPYAVTVGPDGLLYVAGHTSDNIVRYDATTGAFVDEFVPAGSGGLNAASGLTFGADGNLYVASQIGDSILKFHGSTGTFLSTLVATGSGGLNGPTGITFRPDGYLYVSSYITSEILRYDASTGAFVDTFVSAGSGGLSGPSAITWGNDGNLYIACNDNTVKRYDGATGAFIDNFVSTGSGGLSEATGLAFGPDGHLYVSSYQSDQIIKYDGNTGALIGDYITPGAGGLDGPAGITFTPSQQVRVVAYSVPVNNVPGALTTNEDTALVFNAANGNLISISDVDAGAGLMEVSLSVNDGVLGLSGTTGLTFIAGSDGNASMTIQGTLADINAALDGMSFTPDANFNGSVTLQITTVDDVNLIGLYTFDDTANLGQDSGAGVSYDGSATGATSVNDATRGDVISLDGTSHVEIPGFFGEPADVTLAAWVNLTSYDTNGTDIISLGDNLILRYEGWDNSLRGIYYDGTNWKQVNFKTTINLPGDGWHHVAYSVDDTNNTHTIYFDGVAVASAAMTGSIAYDNGANSYIGAHGELSPEWDLIGQVDDVRVYDRALTASEIAQVMNNSPGVDTDTVAITVTPVNDAPTVIGETYTAVEGIPYTATLGLDDLLLNDSDVEGDSLSVNTTPVSGPTNGSLVLNADGTFIYVANDNFNGTDSFVYEVTDGNGGSAQATATITVLQREIRILLTTESDVNSSKVPGISNWDSGEILGIGDPNLSFEPAGSDGSILPYFDLEGFSASNNMTINGLHFVSNDITVGSTNSIDLKRGDILFISESDDVMSSTNTLSITAGDVIVFRPDVAGDYSSGTFIHLLDNPGTSQTTGISLIEKDVLVGDVTLQAGTFIFTQNSVVAESSIYHFTADDVGAGTTSGVVSTLISSVDIDIVGNNFQGVMIVSEDLYLDGTVVPAGSIVTTLRGGDDAIGNNGIYAGTDHIFYLTVSTTTMGSGTTTADATLLFDAGDIGLNNNQKKIRSFTIIEEISAVPANSDPVITLTAGSVNYTEGDPPVVVEPLATLTDADMTNFGGGVLRVDLDNTGTSSDKLAVRDEGTAAGQIGVSGTDVTYGGVVIGSFSGGSNGSEPLTILLNVNADVSAVEALIRNITYENTSSNPSENQRLVNFSLSDGDGGVSNVVTKSIVVNGTNAAPVLTGANDLISINEDTFNSAGTLVSILTSGFITDADPAAVSGIAVVAVDNTNGSWEYTIDGGTTWTAFNSPSVNNVYLLADTPDTSIRFVPNANWNGTVTNGITFHAWDQTAGVNGDTIDMTAAANVRDEFSANSYSNNDGSAVWTSAWTEVNDDGSSSTGNIRIENNKLHIDNQDGGSLEYVYRSADLSDAVSADLTFDFDAFGSGNTDIVNISVSSDGGATWTTLRQGSVTGNYSGTRTINIESYTALTDNMMFRFGVVSSLDEPGEYINFDNIDITYTGGSSGGSSSISAASASSSITVNPINDIPVANSDPADFYTDVSALNPLGYWRLGESSGTTVVDSSGTGNNGTYNGSTLAQAGALANDSDTSVHFNGTSDYVEISHDPAYLVDEGTVLAWFKVDALGNQQTILSKDSSSFDTGGHLNIEIQADGTIAVRQQSIDADYFATSTQSVTAGQWHLLAYSFGSDGMAVYLDGELVATNSYTGGLGASSGGAGNFEPLVIGASTRSSGNLVATPLERYFAGDIDEVAILGSPLSASEIKALYGAGSQNYSIMEDGSLSVTAASGVLINDYDADGDTLTVNTTPVTDVSNGTLTLNSDGSFTYTPNANFFGSDSFTYEISDGNGGTAQATAIITVSAVNDSPVIVTNTGATVAEGSSSNVITTAMLNEGDVDDAGAGLTYTVTADVANGTLKVNGTTIGVGGSFTQADIDAGQVTYDHDGSQTASDSFTFSLADGGEDGAIATTGTFNFTITNVNDAPIGLPVITGTAQEDQTLTADTSGISDDDGLGAFSYQWYADGVAISGATASTYTLTQSEVGTTITVTASYTDDQGTAESTTSTGVGPVTNVNDPAAGTPVITGTPAEDSTLTADTSGISDEDGLGTFSYQWYADGVAISGATASTYTLTQTEVGATITVTVSYTDGQGTAESATSAGVGPVTNVNDLVTGVPVITGTTTENSTLTADTSGISDEDGLGAFSYQWYADGVAISGATASTYTLTQNEVGTTITVAVSYTDGQGTAESAISVGVGPVTNVNDPVVGVPVITGTPAEDQVLTADTSGISDADGLGAFSYQWYADGVAISGATASTYTLTQTEVGATITVTVSYTDGQGTIESTTSAGVGPVTNVNDPVAGVPVITGTPAEDSTLTVDTSGISDEDGLGAFSYQWYADGVAIGGATASTYTLTQNEVGATITVTVSYTDGQGTAESATSVGVGPVTNVNDPVAGTPVITGTPAEDQTLTVDTSGISDTDGLGTFSYQWYADGVAISGATVSTYTLTQAEVGTTITVTVSYTDGQGTAESTTSAGVGPVTNVNDPVAGTPVITGTPDEDQTLTADTSAISDEDGLGAFSYQWYADGVAISGATASTYTLTQAEVGATITVAVSYTDGQGTAESVTSAGVGPVTNVNDPVVGVPVITGTPAEDQTLTADTSGISDADGIGVYSYQWYADGVAISGATASIYTLTQNEVGATITVAVSYTDGQGTAESTTSAGVGPVNNVNDPVVGVPVITGTPAEDQVLTADTSGISDADGLGAFSYQWYAVGVAIGGATTSTFTLTQAEVGSTITVTVSYTDGQGTLESTTSAGVGPVANVNDPVAGTPVITGTPAEDQVLTADTSGIADEDGLGAFSYQWYADGVAISGATASTYTLTQNEVGTTITVAVSYTDGQGTAESATSVGVGPVTNVNDPVAGVPVITGTAAEDQTLTADTSAISDEDGLGTFSYQWYADGVAIGGATASTYTLTQAEVGTTITVTVSYADGQGTAESTTSAGVGPVTNVNDPVVGVPVITGAPAEDQVLTADTSGISDEDGLGVFSYQWYADGVAISGATASTYTLTQTEVGTTITVAVSYTDGQGTAESATSVGVGPVTNVNDPVAGTPVITGTPAEDQTLTADTSAISDEDGLGTFSYQWYADGVAISGATASAYTLTQNEVGTTITVAVTYTDGQGTAESTTSAGVGPVTNVNDSVTGVPVITGTPAEDQVLTADTSGISDEDGLGAFSYQWYADGVAISGATASTYTLTQAEVGTTITVAVSYIDGQGTAESTTSAGVGPVTNVNDPVAGVPVITGTPAEDQTLTVDTSGISDTDGLGAFSYQWYADGVAISGATASTYTLTQSEVGTTITVAVSYTDGQGTTESTTSAGVGPVTNVNDAPVGSVTISGIASEDQTLTASNNLADADGMGTVSYQWQRNGVDIAGATANTYTLGDIDVGTIITVVASYTDGQGTNESVSSAGVGPIVNVNDAPVAGDDFAIVDEGQTVVIDLSTNDTDIDSALDLNSITILTAPVNGSLVVNGDGTVDYIHDGSETNSDSFTYSISDTAGAISNIATVSITINPVNDAPVANSDSTVVTEGGSVLIDLVANDSDSDSLIDLNSIVITTAPLYGTVTVNSDGTVLYTHDSSESTNDSFEYTISDIDGSVSNQSSVSIIITPVNDAPTTSGIPNLNVLEDAPDSLINLNDAFNDADNTDSELNYSIVNVSNQSLLESAAVNNIDGTLNISYAADMNGDTQLTIRASDPSGEFVDTVMSISVAAVNDVPEVVSNGNMTVTNNTPVTLNSGQLKAIDADNASSEILYTVTELPVAGTLMLNGKAISAGDTFTQDDIDNNRLAYNLINMTSADQFKFIVADNAGASSGEQIFSITVSIAGVPPSDSDTDVDVDETVDNAQSTDEGVESVGSILTTPITPIDIPELSVTPIQIPSQPYQPTQHIADSDEFDDRHDNYMRSAGHNTVAFKFNSIADIKIESMKALWTAIDQMKQDISDQTGAFDPENIKSVAITTSGITLTAGIVAWAIRSGALAASMVSTMPLWRGIDPLPILAYKNDKERKQEPVPDIPKTLEEVRKRRSKGLLGNNIDNIESLFGSNPG